MKEKKVKAKIINVFSRRLGAVFIATALAGSVCVPAVTLVPEAKTVSTVKKLKTATVYIRGSKTVSVKSRSKVKWTTSNRKVATVKSAGKTKAKVTGKKAGTATVTGKAGKTKWTMKVRVKKKAKKAAVKTVKLKAVSLTAGKSKTVTANTKSKVSWSSSNKAVVTVKSTAKNKAKVTAKKTGTATVTGKAGKTKWTAKVTVKKKSTNGSNTTKSTTTSTFNKTLLNSKIKVILHECGADTGTTDIQKFARLCRWWNTNIEWGNDYPNGASESIEAKYGEADSNHSLSAAYIVEFKKGVCGTQSQAFKYFSDLLSLKTKCIASYKSDHEWVHVYLDDGWYSVDLVSIANKNGIYNISFDDYLKTDKGQKEYQSNLKSALRYHPQEAEERARQQSLNYFEKYKAYRVADLHDDDNNVNLGKGNVEYGEAPYYIDDIEETYPVSESSLKAELNGKKYINEFLYKYL